MATKAERFAEFLGRLAGAPAASSGDEAYQLLCGTLNAVEDEMTSIPFAPANWMIDGRMYPPQPDSMRPVPGRPDVRRFISRGHNTFIGDNGAIEIQDLSGRTIFAKDGADGLPVRGDEP